MNTTTAPVNWDGPWGNAVHLGTYVPDAHDVTEAGDDQ